MPRNALCRYLCLAFVLISLPACHWLSSEQEIDPAGHLKREDYTDLRKREDKAEENQQAASPPPIPDMPMEITPPLPPALGSDKRVSVTVTDTVPVRDVLIELAREAKVNLELDPRVQGTIIFSAHDQPFDQVLKRICALANLRYKVDGSFIHIEMDEPYQQTYQLDYLALSRRTTSETGIATNVFDVDVTNNASGISTAGGANNGASATQNNSTSKISSASDADFWSEVDKSLTQILNSTGHKTDKTAGAATNFSVDKQSGMVTVYGDSIQQAAVESYFRKLKRKAYAQVLIDARIIEVELDDGALCLTAHSMPRSVSAPMPSARHSQLRRPPLMAFLPRRSMTRISPVFLILSKPSAPRAYFPRRD
jgi:general secretion pathway protein D